MDRLADLQTQRPMIPLLVILAISAICAALASRLELRTRYDQLLPESQPSVIELKRVEKRANVSQSVMVLLESDDHKAMRALGDAMVPRLIALGPDVVGGAEDGIQEARAYLMPRAGLFADIADL